MQAGLVSRLFCSATVVARSSWDRRAWVARLGAVGDELQQLDVRRQ